MNQNVQEKIDCCVRCSVIPQPVTRFGKALMSTVGVVVEGTVAKRLFLVRGMKNSICVGVVNVIERQELIKRRWSKTQAAFCF